MLTDQFPIIIENYISKFKELARSANKHCHVCFVPDYDAEKTIFDLLDFMNNSQTSRHSGQV
jgi:hypothetical protein